MFWIFVLLCSLHLGMSMYRTMDRDYRLLLNDPLIMDRLAKLEQTVQQQEHTIQSQSAEIQQLQNKVNVSAELKPAFFAILGKPTVSIGNSEILKFDVIKTNIGGGYDAVTGVFIAPVSGTYQFVSVIYNSKVDDTVVQLNKNQNVVVNGYSTGDQHATSHTMNAVLTLQKGDHIYVQHRGGSTDGILGSNHCSFSGFMITQ